ncbi:single-stranded-DNA-specific exonuclease RecJ [Rossellomorea aquimaris]|jgi:single-stranded-DNA-specific exonuclease|uniref:Single-stranded-DNA-specific exonuclease RecJ n=1 Tax=Rossellomorea aquimaris TaxID=189382 RepID=A0A5D4TPP6_9BACI|nr:single-stranded-DNA-specific exonuclease RecJ [Rossellomorea aquimaris]TYS77770.1 single-stranded-DNA-specific exonuclease RecJ [Rossellomorea aquimaris]TYS86952.1 single-stranded-DNA-specific exonuclease RecJ [Rossellomorea aquimaris]
MLNSKTRWMMTESDQHKISELANELKVPSLVAKLLINRDLDDVEEARNFLFDTGDSFHDPFLFEDMKKATERIHKAIENGERILVYGDYDADGVSSTSVLMTVLRDLGAEVEFYIPNRFSEGYGPNEGAFRWAKEEEFTLIITVDTGISAVNEAKLAKELDIDLIITDHHEPGPELPPAFALIHPKVEGTTYPFGELAGVGVAFKLAHALYGELPVHLLDLAAIGTIADLVPLRGENRLLAKRGIAQLRVSNRLGIKALCRIANAQQQEITEESIGFMIAPRINAVGRLGDADPAVDLMLTEDAEEAKALAEEIDSLNKERQAIVSQMTEEAVEMVENDFPLKDNAVLVIGKEGWNPGVVGIVASRLVDRFYRPTIVLSFDSEKGTAKGSARSIAGFDLFKNLSTCRDILPHFGGHPMAAGMTLQLDDVAQFRNRLNELASTELTEDDFIPVTQLDASVTVDEISVESIEKLQLLAPFGMHNPKPKWIIDNVSIEHYKKIGSAQNHLKLVLEDKGVQLDGVGFGLGELADHMTPFSNASVIGELSINEWNNRKKPQVFLQDVKIDHWQLFDVRGIKQVHKWNGLIPDEKKIIICFNPATIEKLSLEKDEVTLLEDGSSLEGIATDKASLVLLDLPTSKPILEELLKKGHPHRIYAHFFQEEDHFFSTMPTRDHFKWYYGFLTKRGSFDLNKHGDDLAKYKGWSKETIDFMSQVFFDLKFVTIVNGFISLNPEKTKKDLSESLTYQKKQQQYELENELLYSSYQELKTWFNERIEESVTIEEEVKAWT